MPNLELVRSSKIENSFRNRLVIDQHDLKIDREVKETFSVNYSFPDSWKIGVIVGRSGTGKSTIAKEIFSEDFFIQNNWSEEKSIVDCFDKNIKSDTLFATLNSVGLGTVWSWLKPYRVLSTGEKMRVDVARLLLSEKEIICFDEFTSVVDRDVAKFASNAIQKSIRRSEKKFVAVTCHRDIVEWLEPDWVIDTDSMMFSSGRLLRRPEIKIDIREGGRELWSIFKKYHYMSTELSSSRNFAAFYNNKSIAFFAVRNFFGKSIGKMMQGHRLVVLPDFQGAGIGHILSSEVAQYFVDNGWRFIISSKVKSLYKQRKKDPRWILKDVKASSRDGGEGDVKNRGKARILFNYEFVGKKNG